jgi:predicted acylesterase/phospholipase RssA
MIHEGKAFHDWIRRLLAEKGIARFGDLKVAGENDPRWMYRLQVVVSDVTHHQLLLLPRDAEVLGMDPDHLDVADAVRMSMSIPVFFEPYTVRVLGREVVLVDGGMLSNFPVWVFDSDGIPDWPTFGVKVVDPDPKRVSPGALPEVQVGRSALDDPIRYLLGLVGTMTDAQDKIYLERDTFVRTITISNLGVQATDFNLSRDTSEALYDAGQDATTTFLETWDFEAYKAAFRTGMGQPTRRDAITSVRKAAVVGESTNALEGALRPRQINTASTEKRADLVFEGGGVKGIALAGAFSVLEQRGFETKNVAGTSGGAVVGSLVAAGYTAKELHDLLQETPFTSFQDEAWEDKIVGLRMPLSILKDLGIGYDSNRRTANESQMYRYLNLSIADSQREVIHTTRSVIANASYFLRINIGTLDASSIVENPVQFPSEELEPSSPDGFWLDVVLTSDEVDVASESHRLFLPFVGPSWVCDCIGQEHTCNESDRSHYLYVSFVVGTHTGKATVRCTVYHANNAIQSAIIQLLVADGDSYAGAQRAEIDYSLSRHFTGIDRLPSRRLNILTNEGQGGSHTIVVKTTDKVIPVDLADAAVGDILKAVRESLRRITLGSNGEDAERDSENGKPTPEFVEDLKALALLGSFFWSAILPRQADRLYLDEHLGQTTTIQVSRVTKAAFPWAVVYDIPRELQASWELCSLLASWEDARGELGSYPNACPYEQEHHINVLCPFGFWGFKHIIEQPPSVHQGVLKTAIPVADRAQLVLGLSLALNEELRDNHLTQLAETLGDRVRISSCDSREYLQKALAEPALQLVYFYCHGKWGLLGETSLRVPYLEIGRSDQVGPNDFAAWAKDGKWSRDHWKDVSPLVFINGCETAELTPEGIVNFVEALAGMNAAGVIGTEVSVSQRLAGEIGERFFGQLTGRASEDSRAQTVGVALHRTRLDLLRQGNIAGLIYTAFCSTDLSLTGQAFHEVAPGPTKDAS